MKKTNDRTKDIKQRNMMKNNGRTTKTKTKNNEEDESISP